MTHFEPAGGGKRKSNVYYMQYGEAKRKRKGEEAEERKTASITPNMRGDRRQDYEDNWQYESKKTPQFKGIN